MIYLKNHSGFCFKTIDSFQALIAGACPRPPLSLLPRDPETWVIWGMKLSQLFIFIFRAIIMKFATHSGDN